MKHLVYLSVGLLLYLAADTTMAAPAAALFIDWSLSEEGQSMITTFGRVVARKGVKQRFPELVEKEYFLVDVDFIGPILDQSGKEFSQIFLDR